MFELSQAERHALKLLLHEDVKAIALASLEETTKTPKKFDGAPLPTEPTECLQSVNALIQATEERLFGLGKARSSLKRMVTNATASARVLGGGHDGISEDKEEKATTITAVLFTKLPPPTAYETMIMEMEDEEDEEEANKNKKKRAKTSFEM
jgi:hypothetical protein